MRTAPLMTLLAVGVLGGALFVANTVGGQAPTVPQNPTAAANTAAPAPQPPPAAPPPADGGGDAPADPADPAAPGEEVDLSEIDVAGAEGGPDAEEGADEDAPPPRGGADEADDADAGARVSTFAGESNNGGVTVAIAVNGNDAAAVVTDGGEETVLDGSATAQGLALKDRTGKVKLDGDNPGDGFTGSVTVGGQRVRYTADALSLAKARDGGRDDVVTAADRVGL